MEKKQCCRHHIIHGGSCGTAAARRLRGAARRTAHRASVQVTSAEAVEAAEAGDFLVENASVSQPSFGQEIQSFSS